MDFVYLSGFLPDVVDGAERFEDALLHDRIAERMLPEFPDVSHQVLRLLPPLYVCRFGMSAVHHVAGQPLGQSLEVGNRPEGTCRMPHSDFDFLFDVSFYDAADSLFRSRAYLVFPPQAARAHDGQQLLHRFLRVGSVFFPERLYFQEFTDEFVVILQSAQGSLGLIFGFHRVEQVPESILPVAVVKPVVLHVGSVECGPQLMPRLVAGVFLFFVFNVIPPDGEPLLIAAFHFLQFEIVLQQCILVDLFPVVQINEQPDIFFFCPQIFGSYLSVVRPVIQPEVEDKLPQPEFLVVRIRLCDTFDALPFFLSALFVLVFVIFIGTVGYQRFLAFQRPLIEDEIRQEQIDHVFPEQTVAVRPVVFVQLFRTPFQHFPALQLLVVSALFVQDGLQLVFVIFSFDRPYEVPAYLVCRLFQQMVVDEGSDRLPRFFQPSFRQLLPESPVVLSGSTERPLYLSVLVFLGCHPVLFVFSSDDQLFCLSDPFFQVCLALTMKRPAVLQFHTVPSAVISSIFPDLYINDFQFMIFLPLRRILLFILSPKLEIAPFLVEAEQYPRQLLFPNGLRKCLLPEIIECPVCRNLPAVGNQSVLVTVKIGQHLLKGFDEKEACRAVLLPFPCQFRFSVVKELAVCLRLFSVPPDGCIVVGRQESHSMQHSVQPFPTLQSAFPYSAHTAETCAYSRL